MIELEPDEHPCPVSCGVPPGGGAVRTVAPFGSWHSPISSQIATAGLAAGQIAAPSYVGVVGDEVWWVEPRPEEDGRTALLRRRTDGATESLLPAPWDVRGRVIEYGGRP
jgi:hypothetical protein